MCPNDPSDGTPDAHGDTLLAPTVTPMVEGDDSLPGQQGRDALRQVALRSDITGERYRVEGMLGRGGMGEVQKCRDLRIGRRVAMKVLPTEAQDKEQYRARFLREAQVQGQLEHPAILPVYDLGLDESGAPFFTMKRVRGVTLASVIDQLAAGDADTVASYSRRKLLTLFGGVCQAMQFAHGMGVVHRDLKPDNIMLGHFGEVYVLDWGLAKLIGSEETALLTETALDIDSGARATHMGAVLGTPGYLAPEQARGDLDAIDARTDIYALGTILFELLTLEPLHQADSADELIEQAASQFDLTARMAALEGELPPELTTVCVRATQHDRAQRFESAADVNDAVERYLDGDRDLERRRELADGHVQEARAALGKETSDSETRKRALQGLGRALALEPTHANAQHLLMKLMVEPPDEVPAEVQKRFDVRVHTDVARQARLGVISVVVYAVFLSVVALRAGMRNSPIIALAVVALALVGIRAWRVSRSAKPADASLVPSAFGFMFVVSLSSGMLGPFMIVPAVAVGATAIYLMHPRSNAVMICCLAVASFLAPFVLMEVGVIPNQYLFADGNMIVVPLLTELPEVLTKSVLVIASVVTLLMVAQLLVRLRRSLWDAALRQELVAWQLKQIVPDEAQEAVDGRGS